MSGATEILLLVKLIRNLDYVKKLRYYVGLADVSTCEDKIHFELRMYIDFTQTFITKGKTCSY